MKAIRLMMVTAMTVAVAVSLAAQAPGGGGAPGGGRGAGGGAPGGGGGRGAGGGGGGRGAGGGGGAPGGGAARGGGAPGGGGGGAARGGGGRGGGIPMPLVIINTGWSDGGDIPAKHKGAQGVSPALSWTGAPMTTQAFAILFHDTDVMSGGTDITHWMMWDIPAATTTLAEGVKVGDQADGSKQGRSIGGQNGYYGPAPPAGHPVHHYTIEVYALNAKLGLEGTATRDQFTAALAGKIVSRGTYFGKALP